MSKIKRFFKFPLQKKIQIFRSKLLPAFRVKYCYFGKNSDIYKPILVYNKKNISIGNNVMIRNNARIEAVTQWEGKKYNPLIEIGDGVSIEQGLHLTCANHVKIGRDSMILANVMITDISHHTNRGKDLHDQGITVKETCIEESVFVGKNACIMPGVTLGKHSTIGANAVVTHDVPAYAVVAGVPAKIIKYNQ